MLVGCRIHGGMEEPLVIQTLKRKRAEITGAIADYQAQIAQARHDLDGTGRTRTSKRSSRAQALS
jgi:hypothetical protein